MQKRQAISNICWLLIFGWAGLAIIFWALNPGLSASATTVNLHGSAYQVVKGLGNIGTDLLVILLGYQFSKSQDWEKIAVKGWIITWLLGTSACLIVAACFSKMDVATFQPAIFNSLFPLIRGSYPITFGIIIGLLLNYLIHSLYKDSKNILIAAIWGTFAIAFIHFPNIWGWGDTSSTISYALITLLGSLMVISQENHWNFWLLTALVSEIINICCQLLIPFMSRDSNSIGRFTGSFNVLTVLSAYALARLLFKKLDFPNANYVFNFLTLLENSAIIIAINSILSNHSTLKICILSILLTIAAMSLAWIIVLFQQTKVFKNYDQQLDSFGQLPLKRQYSSLFKHLTKWIPNIALLIISYVVAAISMLLINYGHNPNLLNYVFTQRETIIYINAFLCFICIKFVQALTKRYWLSCILITAINFLIIIANLLKLQARSEPILPADLQLINVAGKIFGMVSPIIWILAVIIIIALIILTIYLEKHWQVKYRANRRMRLFMIILAPLVFLSSASWNHSGYPTSNIMNNLGDERTFWNQARGAYQNGPIIQFMNNIDISVMSKPTGYSKTEMKKIKKYYLTVAKNINHTRSNQFDKQNIVFILSESFANPDYVPGIKLKNNPIPYITSIEKHNTGGRMISSGYGGGTANMEYMALTGFMMCNFSPTMATPYSQLVTSLNIHPSIVDNFKYAVAIHPYDGAFYNRINVYKKFGFNRFYYLGNKSNPIRHKQSLRKNGLITDYCSYENVLDQLNSSNHNGEFINLVTMQNHFPYNLHHFHEKNSLKPSHVSEGTNISSLEDYTNGINLTDESTKLFIRQINKINKPITVVFYGDHLPGGIYGNSMAKDGLKLHETDYFIYSNRYARQHGARKIKKSANFVSPSDFIAMASMQTNSKVNWYQALLTQMYQKNPVFTRGFEAKQDSSDNTATQIVSRQGKLMKYSQLSKKQKRIYHDYQLVQYDITAGRHYLVNDMK